MCKWCILTNGCLDLTRQNKGRCYEKQTPHQRDFAPVDVELGSELLVAANDWLHLLTAAQLVLRTLYFTQA